jgi:integrase
MRQILFLGVLIAAVAIVAGCGGEETEQAEGASTTGGRVAMDPAEGGKMAVKVNGTTITEAEVAEEEGRLTMAMGGRMDPQQLESMKPMIREQAVNNLIKSWTRAINLKGNYGAHTLRKTWGYMQRTKYGVGFEIICKRFNHSSPAVTMRYLGIEDKEVHSTLMNEIG